MTTSTLKSNPPICSASDEPIEVTAIENIQYGIEFNDDGSVSCHVVSFNEDDFVAIFETRAEAVALIKALPKDVNTEFSTFQGSLVDVFPTAREQNRTYEGFLARIESMGLITEPPRTKRGTRCRRR